MIYMKSADGEVRIVILESANLDAIRAGKPAKTPDGSVLICWTPDMVWLADKLADSKGDAEVIANLIDEASKRPQAATPRPYHKTHTQRLDQ